VNASALANHLTAGPLLLDFDGPVCSVFAGYPAPQVARELISLLGELGVSLPPEILSEEDPMVVLQWAGDHPDPKIVVAVEDALCAAELKAVDVAEPTPFGHETILNAAARGIAIAIVSNNSASAVERYLTTQGLAEHVSPVVGRAYADPARMKPSPEPIFKAAQLLDVPARICTLIGDSLSDLGAAKAAGIAIIGYANRDWKVDAFQQADVVVTTMQDIADALR